MANVKEKTLSLLGTVTGWDSQGVAGTETVIYTVPPGKTCIVTHIVMRTISLSMATAVVTFGIGGGSCDEFRGDTTLTNLDGTTKYAVIHQQATTRNTPDCGVIITAGNTLSIEVTTADADGGTATIDAFGYLY